MDTSTQFFERRAIELANRSYEQGIYTFTNFLNIAEISTLYGLQKELGRIPFCLFGGTIMAERQIARFGSQEMMGYEVAFPIVCLHITPLMKKFADQLTHRDFLGAVMNLGIEREKIGDILVKEKECFLFCMEDIAPYIERELFKIKHTQVRCQVVESVPNELSPVLVEKEELLASERIDAVIAKIFHFSRNASVELFRGKKIYVDGKLMENNAHVLKKGSIVSVRGYGKFIYDGMIATTKKDKLRISYRLYST